MTGEQHGPRPAGGWLASRVGTTPLAACGLVLLLAACGGGGTSGADAPSSQPSAPPSATTSRLVAPSPLGYTPADPQRVGSWVVFTPYTAKGAPEQKVLTAWMSFAREATRAYNLRTIDFAVLDAISTGSAREGTLQLIGERIKGGRFTVGQVVVEVRGVQVTGTTATVDYCQDDQSYEVDRAGKAVSRAPGVAAGRDTLVLVKGKWLVSKEDTTPHGCPAPTPVS